MRSHTKLKHILIIGVAFVELFLFSQYKAHDAVIHFFLHSLAGVNAALLIFITLSLQKRPSRNFIFWAFTLHQYAMLPDYLYQAGSPHQPWMNVFLGHVFLDNLSYHEWILSGLAVFLGTVYLSLTNKAFHNTPKEETT
ncbi:hypothetical protein H0X09_01465 [Candidatus Saccharibacteria bacterium]|nr:hypothetical protein [Candidatus Saccharibacteria bacterium]